MNEFNVLLGAATNGTPSGSLFDALFARYIAPQESWRELESPLPITILSAGEDLIDYRIYGNTENGESVGEKSENLLDKDVSKWTNGNLITETGQVSRSGYYSASDYISVLPDTLYGVYAPNRGYLAYNAFYDSDKNFLTSFSANGMNVHSATSPANAAYIRCSILSYSMYPDAFASAMLFKGSTAPTSYIPYGYKLPMVSKTDNLLIMDDVLVGYWNSATTDWNINLGNGNYRSTKTAVSAGTYMFSFSKPVNVVRIKIGATWIYDGNDPAPEYQNITSLTITADTDADIGISARNAKSTAAPWGDTTIELVKSITTPVYIGSDPLAEGEYVDFGEQKVYRMEGGTLTPTDPPVPIPALPTIDGETIIDYNPSETPAVEPEKMYVKYKP